LCPPGVDHDVRSDVRPIKGKVQEAHPSKAAGDELDGIIMRREPAEDREGRCKWKDVLWQEGPEEDPYENHPEDANLLLRDIVRLAFAAEGAVQGYSYEC
jgi:hypothetical protein